MDYNHVSWIIVAWVCGLAGLMLYLDSMAYYLAKKFNPSLYFISTPGKRKHPRRTEEDIRRMNSEKRMFLIVTFPGEVFIWFEVNRKLSDIWFPFLRSKTVHRICQRNLDMSDYSKIVYYKFQFTASDSSDVRELLQKAIKATKGE